MTNVISFIPGQADNYVSAIPCIDEVPLTKLIEQFEAASGYDTAGGYEGLHPNDFAVSAIEKAIADDASEAKIFVLGCSCGEIGCWPLIVSISKRDGKLVWSNFRQPHRPDRTYENFGSFVFEQRQYENAVSKVVACWPSQT